MKRLFGLLLFVALLACAAIAVRTFSASRTAPGAAAAAGDGEIVALRDKSTLLVQKGSVGQDLVDWLASHDRATRTFELGGDQFVGRSAEPTPEAIGRATRLVALLRANPDVTVTVVGHADRSADAAADQALSLARARQLMQTLANGGIHRERLHAEGHGSDEPLADNRTAEGRARNQRVSLTLTREH